MVLPEENKKVERAADAAQCRGVRRIPFPLISDPRGNLVFAEFPTHLPFQPKRIFAAMDIPMGTVRGEHAHKKLEQIIICLKGALTVTVDDGRARENHILDSPDSGIYIPPLVWGIQSGHTADCVMLVLASDVYEESDYLRDYAGYLAYLKNGGGAGAA